MSFFEAAMLICFGASWPAAIHKTYSTKNVKGKSRLFAWLVIIGYLCGMIHKVLYNFDFVFYLYLLDLLLVATDLTLVYIYRDNRDKKFE